MIIKGSELTALLIDAYLIEEFAVVITLESEAKRSYRMSSRT